QTGQFAQTQKIMLYAFPAIFAIGGFKFPIGVLIYWTATNFWAVGQQLFIIRRNPTPGSIAERELNERRAAKGLAPVGKAADEAREKAGAQDDKPKGQRKQPVRNPRKKR